ncbi:hypothetical protein [Rhizobium sp. S163]|uniref:hypothetical protein n=1 Tax=Rhizobium sp. S163 TaxID=3055039 RepID=UPI0025AA10B6|nr:hypothetical protein [Rhizobium sp. S163]MDM9644459.1 hypothetical protein [Rhizobium sp. S163]
MSKRTLIGIDGTGAACIKIMADASYDPLTTPDSDYAKFDFNSKDAGFFQYAGSDVASYGGNSNFRNYYPGGTGSSNYGRADIGNTLGYTWVAWTKDYFPNLDYALPVHDMKRVIGGWVQGALVSQKSYGFQNRAGEYALWQAQEGGWMQSWSSPNFAELGGSKVNLIGTRPATSTWPLDVGDRQLVVWNLPGDETALLSPPLAPVPGQMSVQINSTQCRVAKTGYDVRTASRTQLAFDSVNRPLKVIYAADLAVPSGTTNLDMTPYLRGIGVTGQLLVDISAYTGGTLYFPTTPATFNTNFGIQYIVSGTTVVLNNPYGACRARVVVFASDNSAQTVGSNRVLRQFNDGTQDVVQFLRPGASNTPSLADVIIDSRWPTLRILAQGTIGLSGGNGVQYSIPFNSNGLFPIVKFMTIHGGGTNTQFNGSFGKRVRTPFTKLIYYNNDAGTVVTSGDSTYCLLTANEARFFSFIGNPIAYTSTSSNVSPGYTIGTTGDANPPYAIRYYILGIPA